MNQKISILIVVLVLVSTTSCNGQVNNPQGNTPDSAISNSDSFSDRNGLLMNEEEFWKTIDKSRTAANNDYQKQIKALTTILTAHNPDEIERFNNRFTELLSRSYDWNLWGAAYVINGGCSDDCFHYFRQYLIGQGKERFYQTLKDPESCAGWMKSEEEDNWEGLQYSAMEAYQLKTGKNISQSYNPRFELKGKPFDEDRLLQQYPKLAKKFMGGN